MGETLTDARFADNITIRATGVNAFLPTPLRLSGNITRQLAGTATAARNCRYGQRASMPPPSRGAACPPARPAARQPPVPPDRRGILYARSSPPLTVTSCAQSLVPVIARLHARAPPKTGCFDMQLTPLKK